MRVGRGVVGRGWGPADRGRTAAGAWAPQPALPRTLDNSVHAFEPQFPSKTGCGSHGCSSPNTPSSLYLLGIRKDCVLPSRLFPVECGRPDLNGGGSDGPFQVEAFGPTWSRSRGGAVAPSTRVLAEPPASPRVSEEECCSAGPEGPRPACSRSSLGPSSPLASSALVAAPGHPDFCCVRQRILSAPSR